MTNRTVKVNIDGRDVYGFPGQKLLDLCREAGVDIPTLCYDPHLSTHGGCSMCLVEIEGAKALARACANDIAPNMVVRTDTTRVTSARRLALELMLSDHVGDCRSPCTLACPAQGKVQAYVNLTALGDFRAALDALHDNIPLPAGIGRVCPAPCQKKCRRNLVDETVSIREIKRFVGDWGIASQNLGALPAIEENGFSVGVVGAGPAGLSCAYFLRRAGCSVTIYEREAKPGGMMRYGIPDYRLPQEVIDAEAAWILSHGIELKTGVALGRDVQLEELRLRHDAVVLAMGCWKSQPMRVKGEDSAGVVGGIDFLYTVNTHNPMKVGRRVAVVGGGNTAMDACRSARRLGAEKVYVVYRRTREEMPAEPDEIREAMEEGVEFVYLAAPKSVLVDGDGKANRLLCERMELGEPDASGRRSPVPTGAEFEIEADMVISAIGQTVDLSLMGPSGTLHDGRHMNVDADYATPLAGVFVCGDQQTGAKIAIEAIGNGHWCADSVEHYLKYGVAKKPFVYDVTNDALTEKDFEDEPRIPRVHPAEGSVEARLAAPDKEYARGYTLEQVLSEAKRCMECGCPDIRECKLRKYATELEACPDWVSGARVHRTEDENARYVRNMDKCVLCGKCVRVCDEVIGVHAIDFVRRGFDSTIAPQFLTDMESSDCVFCGLCVQACPVGALTERRIERLPHQTEFREVRTTCPHCPLGCEIILNISKADGRVARVTTDLENPASPNRGLTCLRGKWIFGGDDRITTPTRGGEPIDWSTAMAALSEAVKKGGRENTAFFLSASLTDQELEAMRPFIGDSAVTVKGITKLLDLAPLDRATTSVIQDMARLAAAVDLSRDTSQFDPKLKALYAVGANIKGLLNLNLNMNSGHSNSRVFIGCAPEDFPELSESAPADSVVLSVNARPDANSLFLPITSEFEREGTYTGLWGGVLPVHAGPLPPDGVKSLRWIFSRLAGL
ncbi:MAG: FAD-dependent oxidoreductase [Synergistaceae bacterium]|jgi:formate dehydrogenase major subunit|nr:FAD-dependent oxidoreductase [Synergistaceae bacterium]